MIATPNNWLKARLGYGFGAQFQPWVGSTRARDYSDLFYHRGASQGSARCSATLGARLEIQLGLAWPGSSSVGERTALSWVVLARLRSVLTSIRLVSVRFSGYGSARL